MKSILLFKTKTNETIARSKFRFANFVRFIIIIWATTLVIYNFFAIERIINNNFDKSKIIASGVILFALFYTAGIASKMNKYSFVSQFIYLIMTSLLFCYATWITIEMVDFIPLRHSAPNYFLFKTISLELLSSNREYGSILLAFALTWPIGLYIIAWTMLTIVLDRNVRPYFFKYMILRLCEKVSLWIGLCLFTWFVSSHFSAYNPSAVAINFKEKEQMHYLVILSFIVIFWLACKFIKLKKYSKLLKKDELIHNSSISLSLISILSSTGWFIISASKGPESISDIIMLVVSSIFFILSFLFTLFKNSKLSSPVIVKFVLALSITIIWIMKFLIDYSLPNNSQDFDAPVTIGSIALILSLLVAKNIRTNIVETLAIIILVNVSSIYILSQWVIKNWQDASEFLDKIFLLLGFGIMEFLNTIVIGSSVLLLVATAGTWYYKQGKINKTIRKEIKIIKKGAIHE